MQLDSKFIHVGQYPLGADIVKIYLVTVKLEFRKKWNCKKL